MCVYDNPDSHPFITERERTFLMNEMGQLKRKADMPGTPWMSMLSNKPMWALIIAQFGHDWGFYAMNSDINKYYNDVMQFSTKDNGLYSALPFFVMWIVSVSSGMLCDWLVNRGRCSVTKARKWFTCTGE